MATTGTITFVALYSRGETAIVNAAATMAVICDSVARDTSRYVTADVTASSRMHRRTLTKSEGPNNAATDVDRRYDSGKPGSAKSRTGQSPWRTCTARANVTK